MNRNYFICPHCGQLGFSIKQKLLLAPFWTAACSSCNGSVSMDWKGFAVEIFVVLTGFFIAGLTRFITGSDALKVIIVACSFILAVLMHLMVTPLVERKQ